MNQTTLLFILALVFLGLLVLALLVWAIWVRRFVKRSGARTASPYSLAALVTDLSTSLIYSRGRLPWFIRFFAVLLALLVSTFIFAVLMVLFGT
ncbi:MAG: hypothetical protein HZA90_18075 [Verrucomicrobia bacterium]|nr:hypothetical protein [Verrucomicrobiota bacterium]